MNFYLSSELTTARQTSLLDDARRQHLVRQSRMARRFTRRNSPLRSFRPLRLAVWHCGPVSA